MRVVVVALGKIGLPLAAHVARAGHTVVGCDVDARVCELVNVAQAPFPGEAGLAEALAEVVGDGRLRAQTDTAAAVAEGTDLVIAVPPLVVDADAQPDWRILDSVVDDIAGGLREAAADTNTSAGKRDATGAHGSVVCVETTLPVGTTRTRIAPALAAASGLEAERDFFVAFSPERVYSGRIFEDLRSYPKLVGGCSETGEARAVALYEQFIDAPPGVWPMGSAEAAELAKLAETTYRDLNIGFANELARHADRVGVDVMRVIDASNSQPFSHIHRPGVAVGGHCIPVYPHFYLQGDPEARLPGVAREVNRAMPAYAVELLEEALGGLDGARVVVLGVAYRGGVKATAFSGAFPLRDALAARGATVVAADPLYDDGELTALGFATWDGGAVDGAIVQADHDAYRALTPADLPGARAVVDGRHVLDPAPFAAAGVALRRIGRP
ncbi:MAG TPA: nucleotide sugar dehydrogenase [Conexibacter sp.]|jgi:nucleotide sugar dehydrogenase|nr:nucleotide sugar dehydrogenase [Conexibacter sp.]